MSLEFRHINYYVFVPNQGQGQGQHAAPARPHAAAKATSDSDVELTSIQTTQPQATPATAPSPPPGMMTKQLLRDVSGFFKPKTLTALMGSSGAGKTTLMDVLAQYKTEGVITGDIYLNGIPLSNASSTSATGSPAVHVHGLGTGNQPSGGSALSSQAQLYTRSLGVVQQQDLHLGTTTVREALLFSAKLRLPASVTPTQRESFIDELLVLLELDSIAHHLIGDVNITPLSPHQLKRVTIGVELAANPSILFLDEPTSGLDSRAAFIVMRVIKNIALTGRTVCCTIHQPSAELFYMFDSLLLLKSGGSTVYFGEIGSFGSDLVDYFENAPIPSYCYKPSLPNNTNPASWMLDVIGAGAITKGEIADYALIYEESALKEQAEIELDQLLSLNSAQRLSITGTQQARLANGSSKNHDTSSSTSDYAAGFFQQFTTVLTRCWFDHYRNVSYNLTRWGILLFLGVLFGLLYLQIDDSDLSGLNSKIAVVYTAVSFNGVLNTAVSLPVNFRNRESYYREQSSKTYSSTIYGLCIGIIEIPFVLISNICFMIPFYFMVGFHYEVGAFFQALVPIYLTSLAFNSLGHFFAAIFPNIMVASILQGMWFSFSSLFSGVFIRAGSIPVGWKWFYYINPIPKGWISFIIVEYKNDLKQIYDPTQFTSTTHPTKELYAATFLDAQINTDWYLYYIAWLGFTILVLRLLVIITLKYVSHLKR